MSYVAFVHPDLIADLVAASQAGEPVECELRDGQLVRWGGADVIPSDRLIPSFERFTMIESPRLAAGILPQPRGRGAQWKRERQGWPGCR